MEQVEAPIEAIEQIVHREAHAASKRWISHAAFGTSIFAVLAAISAMIANHQVNESMIEQIQSSDQWNYYQARAIKSFILSGKLELLQSLNLAVPQKDQKTLEKYMQEQDLIFESAKDKDRLAIGYLGNYFIFSRSVTLFQIAIGLAAISVLSEKSRFWLVSLVFAVCGLFFFLQGLWNGLAT